MKNCLVSVIIPNYCHAAYLDQRIQSVLNQTYRDFELIILDDCSPDNGASRTIIEKYRNNPWVSHIVYNEKNSGSTFKQWQKGFQLAKGEYIWIAESDDNCDADFLEVLVEQTQTNPSVSIVYCNSQYVDIEGHYLSPIFPKSTKIELFEGKEFIKKHMAFGNAIWNASSALFNKRSALAINSQYTKFVSAGDRLFWIELAETGHVVHILSPKNYFRQHQNKVTPTKQRKGITSREDYKITRYLEKKGYINFITSLYVRQSYMQTILSMDLESEQIKKDLLHLWMRFGFFSIKRIEWFSKVYNKIF